MGWILPTGHIDHSVAPGDWSNEANAYDNNTTTYANYSVIASGYWTYFLELTHSSIPCDKLRFHAGYSYPPGLQIDMDAYYSGAWHHVYQGSFTYNTYVEKTLGGTYNVTALRIRIYNGTGSNLEQRLMEAHFNQVLAPTVTTQACTAVTGQTATGNGNITATGGANATQRGFCYMSGTSGDPTTANSKVYDNGSFGTGAFAKTISGLSPSSNYRVRAYAINAIGTSYGATVQLTTDNPPTVTTQAVTEILSTTAMGNGNITALGGETPTKRGFQYKSRVNAKDITVATQEDPCKITITGHGYTTGDTVIIFDVVGMIELNGKTYEVTKVDDDSFTLDDIDATEYTEYTSGGKCDKWTGDTLNVEDTGEYGTGAYTKGITDLSPGTTYYIRAYAYSTAGYGYGIWVYFITDKVAPTVTTQDPTNVLITSVTGNGNITALGGENATVRGFKYGLTKTDTWDVHDEGSYGAGAFTKSITENLSANTIYWIQAYATNSIGTSYGDWVQFQTAAAGTTPTGTMRSICSDYSGYTYILNESLTDDGFSYESYFTLSTDLAEKQGLHIKKRLLDIFSYFERKDSGTCKIYIKCDGELEWQYCGEISMTGDTDIVVKHLPSENQDSSGDVDFLAKHYLIKFELDCDFDYIGSIFEFVPIGTR